MPCKESIVNAKATFVSAVSNGIDTLMQCGYSRDRATLALMREINRGDSTRPSDDEIFETMTRYNLGIEEATKAIVVSRALRRAMETCSPAKAIEHLASKIAVKRLLYESSDEEPTSDDECLPINPNLRVDPISTMDRLSSISRSTPMRKARASNSKGNRSRKATPAKSNAVFRKRSIDEIATTERPEDAFSANRSRSESMSEEVSAKIAQQASGDDVPVSSNTLDPSNAKSASTVRAKRTHRSEESETTLGPSSNKRIRSTDA
mmetsp:Transcript_95240/g.274297  ORF Transcript_95240/g.274297 Transcript_95240/m.274297 type:complete len:264 (-) Transcript_95240:149-940(-)|eukprot:CAMPEP_0170253762 /NCGR_PEP_ID=MMETSP0116_2-20130129/26725_1 /TAXON_ID=400756 /ORGANISM="Durinskia baltica, Strain CSIRO CS-38" /LENGTH=263 /DNA_ID=CAMNT_0010504753 /DNA_START=294 /DNA_END=1085 /DNA_ORIENTATION=+